MKNVGTQTSDVFLPYKLDKSPIMVFIISSDMFHKTFFVEVSLLTFFLKKVTRF